jgi:DNA adenine methylase
MKYIGSKRKIAKEIVPLMLSVRRPGQLWVEPFVGGANVIDKVDGPRWGNDVNPYLIALLQAVQNEVSFPDVDENLYREIKANKKNFDPALVGFAGFLCSFGAKFFRGFARDSASSNYADCGRRELAKQRPGLVGAFFSCMSYLDMQIPDQSLIYCDPPYQGAQGYGLHFDHRQFWQWCRDQERHGSMVFVSELRAPEDFHCIWEKEIRSQLRSDKRDGKPQVERLFSRRQSSEQLVVEK